MELDSYDELSSLDYQRIGIYIAYKDLAFEDYAHKINSVYNMRIGELEGMHDKYQNSMEDEKTLIQAELDEIAVILDELKETNKEGNKFISSNMTSPILLLIIIVQVMIGSFFSKQLLEDILPGSNADLLGAGLFLIMFLSFTFVINSSNVLRLFVLKRQSAIRKQNYLFILIFALKFWLDSRQDILPESIPFLAEIIGIVFLLFIVLLTASSFCMTNPLSSKRFVDLNVRKSDLSIRLKDAELRFRKRSERLLDQINLLQDNRAQDITYLQRGYFEGLSRRG